MMKGLEDMEEAQYFDDNPKIILLFKVYILQSLTPYIEEEANKQEIFVEDKMLKELRLQ